MNCTWRKAVRSACLCLGSLACLPNLGCGSDATKDTDCVPGLAGCRCLNDFLHIEGSGCFGRHRCDDAGELCLPDPNGDPWFCAEVCALKAMCGVEEANCQQRCDTEIDEGFADPETRECAEGTASLNMCINAAKTCASLEYTPGEACSEVYEALESICGSPQSGQETAN